MFQQKKENEYNRTYNRSNVLYGLRNIIMLKLEDKWSIAFHGESFGHFIVLNGTNKVIKLDQEIGNLEFDQFYKCSPWSHLITLFTNNYAK